MTLFLTGSPTRYGEDHFTADNGFRANVVAALRAVTGGRRDPRVLLVSAAPDDPGFTESVKEGMSLCIHRSGIATSAIVMLDRHNADKAPELVRWADWVILCGGHVPTQNRFLHEIGMRRLLQDYRGVVMGCSAGSMNCAGRVYAHPELPGEAADPGFNRWLQGLGLTDINIIPHWEQVREARVDGLRLIEDVAFHDSWRHPFYTFRDGGY
ncbi:MAG: Type 1 glutamine amidotransferase-like domain-containing protein, partial [Bacteroidales bacterium]|nr:Type 1 glutamine amidotransferase-like domain-containing protein [Bacteroidales bacterium]